MSYSRKLLLWVKSFPVPFEAKPKPPQTKAELLTENAKILAKMFPIGLSRDLIREVEFTATFDCKAASLEARAKLIEVFDDRNFHIYSMTVNDPHPDISCVLHATMPVTPEAITDIEWRFNKHTVNFGGIEQSWGFMN